MISCRQTNNEDRNLSAPGKTITIKEIYLIPKDYTGKIEIYFDQADGSAMEFEDSVRVYRIPETGVLKTQFKFNAGPVYKDSRAYYYVDNKGNRKRLTATADISSDTEGIAIFIDHHIVEKNKAIGERYYVDSLKFLGKYIDLKKYNER